MLVAPRHGMHSSFRVPVLRLITRSRLVLGSSPLVWPIYTRTPYLRPEILAFISRRVTPRSFKLSTSGKTRGVHFSPDTLGM